MMFSGNFFSTLIPKTTWQTTSGWKSTLFFFSRTKTEDSRKISSIASQSSIFNISHHSQTPPKINQNLLSKLKKLNFDVCGAGFFGFEMKPFSNSEKFLAHTAIYDVCVLRKKIHEF